MIKIDLRKYIHNRMWFGWWYSYSWSRTPIYAGGKWQRARSRRWTPVKLVATTFDEDSVNLSEFSRVLSESSDWAKLYDKI